MKKILKYTMIMLTILFITPQVLAEGKTYYTNINNIQMTETQYNNLLALGFNDEEIATMNEDAFEDNKNLEATLLSQNTKYYKTTTVVNNGITSSITEEVTKTEYDNSTQTRGTFYSGYSETSFKRVDTYISRVDTITLRYKVTLNWKQFPAVRSYDIIGLGFEQSKVAVNSMIAFQQNYTYTNNTVASSQVCTIKQMNTGVGATFKLPTGSLKKLSSYMYFNIRKVATGTISDLYAGGDYAHATSSITQNNAQNYTVNHVTGIELANSISNYYDIMPLATAMWFGTW